VTAGLALDVDATVDAADDQPLNPWTRLVTLFGDREVEPVITTDDTALSAQIETVAASVDRSPVDATIAIDGTTPSVVQPAEGRQLDREGSADAIVAALTSGAETTAPIELPVDISPVHVDEAEAQRILDETVTPALSAPVSVVSTDDGPDVEVPVTAIASSLTFTPQESGELTVAIDPAALQTSLGEELKAFGTPAEDARFEVSGGSVSVVPSVDGTGIDPTHLAEQLLAVLTRPAPRSVSAELGPVPADFTTEEAQALGIKEEIGSFTTNIGNPNSGENIRVVAEEVDGAVVMPGETFSLNTFTGPRGTAQGYVPAGVISGGQFTQAVGGGISQFATTMFNAVFFSGLEDVYHKPHSYYISRYPAGREATVYEGQIDLQWKNDSDTGVYIDTTWTPGTITVTFYGTKRYEIESISGNRVNVREPAVQEKPDDGTCHSQAGAQGFDITVTRVFRDLSSGAEIKRENFRTHYAAEPIIRCIPPAAPAPAPGG
jgi:vancomycin resistance protein YoaR